MIIGVGCDLAEVGRIGKALQRKGFRERVYTAAEIEYCTGPKGDKVESYAARFAAKEAFLKALGTGLREGRLLEIEVLNDGLGQPELHLSGHFAALAESRGVTDIRMSLSHTGNMAMAVVILEGA